MKVLVVENGAAGEVGFAARLQSDRQRHILKR